MFATLGVILTLLISQVATADMQINVSQDGTDTVEIRMVSNIRLTENLSVAGNWICHDGLHIYFNSEDSCKDSNKSDNNLYKHNCTGSLEIIPIRELEFIYINAERQKFMTRFYKVSTDYNQQKVTLSKSDYERLAEIRSLSEIEYKVSEIEELEVATCENRRLYPPTNILAEERDGSTREKYISQALLKAGLPIVNSPFGRTESISLDSPLRQIEISAPKASLFKLNTLQSFPMAEKLFEPEKAVGDQEERASEGLKSPFCNFAYSTDRFWFLAGGGGHVGGGGFSAFDTDRLQEISRDLWLEPTVDNKQLENYLKKEYDPNVRLFETGCGGAEL